MNITVHGQARGSRQMAIRLEQIAIPAGNLISRRLKAPLPDVEFVLTDGVGVDRLLHQAHAALGGPGKPTTIRGRIATKIKARRAFASTAMTHSGVLILINGPEHRGNLHQFDRTVVHELVHAVQFNLPGARERHITYLRMCAGYAPDRAFLRNYERLIDARECEAEGLESLARQLPRGH
ncbi:hypothetical protein [Streptomyces malaysiensis]|uniref:SprT-like domain-containing protein n=1 Tax=Streptomyces malaysiensis subsp. samsunensis TaxID=459658 RepID=A0A9X2RVA5_STRMQ|nr:hypothetical protein [Streptomyces samsunensis]MCQ8831778.1 hypothetical protein [Streptomyces samsunensis]